MRIWNLTCIAALHFAGAAFAQPAPPEHAPRVAELEVGIFCALQAMDRMPAPGTTSGWIHAANGLLAFHWPDRQVVPAALGLAFGVQARTHPGQAAASVEMHVFRPGSTAPDVWGSSLGETAGSMAFFRFDRPDELLIGTWVFEAWEKDERLYRVEFDVVPAVAMPGIVGACGATS